MTEKKYEIVCPHCKKKNIVTVLLNEAFNDTEDVHCAFCGLKITELPAAKPPKTECVEE